MALKTGEMTGLERIVSALQHKEGDRVPAGPLVCGAARRVLGITYEEWAQDSDLAVESMVHAQKLIQPDGVLLLVDLSVEGADFGGPMVFPIEDTPHPVYRDNLIKTLDDYHKIERIDPRKSKRMSHMVRYTDGVMKAMGNETGVMTFCYGPLGILSMLRGAEKLFLDCMKNPEVVHEAVRDHHRGAARADRRPVRDRRARGRARHAVRLRLDHEQGPVDEDGGAVRPAAGRADPQPRYAPSSCTTAATTCTSTCRSRRWRRRPSASPTCPTTARRRRS